MLFMAWILHLVEGILVAVEATAAHCVTLSISHDVPCPACICILHSAFCICHHFAHECRLRAGIGNLGEGTCQFGTIEVQLSYGIALPVPSRSPEACKRLKLYLGGTKGARAELRAPFAS